MGVARVITVVAPQTAFGGGSRFSEAAEGLVILRVGRFGVHTARFRKSVLGLDGLFFPSALRVYVPLPRATPVKMSLPSAAYQCRPYNVKAHQSSNKSFVFGLDSQTVMTP